MPDRELIDTGTDKRYVRRYETGRFEEFAAVAKPLVAHRLTGARHIARSGQGDRGDHKA